MSSTDLTTKRNKIPGTRSKAGERTALITAPVGTDTSVLRQVLKQRGFRAFAADELNLFGAPMSMVVMEAIARADIVIAVLGGPDERGSVLFELGVAQGLKKPTLIIAPHDEETFPGAPSGIPYLRTEPDNSAALEFGLAQFLAAPHHRRSSPRPAQRETRPLGPNADELLARLRANHEGRGDGRGKLFLQDLIVQALRASGVSTISVGEKQHDTRIDLAVSTNDLEPWIRNPLMIQVKESLRGKGELDTLVRRFASAWGRESVNWALVIYGEAAPEAHRLKHLHPHILLISAEEFLASLRDTAFGDLIRKLRNERVHGGCRDAPL